VAVCVGVAVSGVQCVSDLLVAPSQSVYTFDPVLPVPNTVNIGDTIAIPQAQLTVDGRVVVVGLGASVVTGATVLKVDSLGRLIVLGPGDGVVRVHPISAALPTDTLHQDFALHAAVPKLTSTGPDAIYSIKDTVTLAATPRTNGGVAIAGAPVAWSLVSGSGIVTLLNASTGQFRGEANGDAVIMAASDSATLQRTIRVRQRATKVLPAGAVVFRALGRAQVLTPQAQDARNNSVTGGTTRWGAIPHGKTVTRGRPMCPLPGAPDRG
jgi:hypothetical protein